MCHYLLIYLEVRFEKGHHHSSETGAVSKSRIFAKVSIQMLKTAIRDQNPASRYGIYVTQYTLCNKVQFQSTQSSETHKIFKTISANAEARYPGLKSGINNPEKLRNIRNAASVLKIRLKYTCLNPLCR